MKYEFSFPGGGVISFDWELRTIRLYSNYGRKSQEKEWKPIEGEYSFEELPLFTSFFVTGMSALYGLDTEIRGKMVITSEGFVLEIYKAKENGNRPAFLLAYDTKNEMSSAFVFNRASLYAFLQMIKVQDKIVSAGETVWEKSGGDVYLNRLLIPFQKAKALEWTLFEGLREGKYPLLTQVWDEGVLRIRGRRLEVIRKREDREQPFVSLSLKNPIDVMRILSCL